MELPRGTGVASCVGEVPEKVPPTTAVTVHGRPSPHLGPALNVYQRRCETGGGPASCMTWPPNRSDAVNQRATLPLSSSVAGYPRDTRIPQALTVAPPSFVSFVLACNVRQPRGEALPTPASRACALLGRLDVPSPILHRRQLWLRHPHFPPHRNEAGQLRTLSLSFSRFLESRVASLFIPYLIPIIVLLVDFIILRLAGPTVFSAEESRTFSLVSLSAPSG